MPREETAEQIDEEEEPDGSGQVGKNDGKCRGRELPSKLMSRKRPDGSEEVGNDHGGNG
jgi:hypothetical protein